MEEWRDIIGYEGSYMVSSTGRVKSLDREVKGSYNSIQKRKGRVLKEHMANSGYKVVSFSKNVKATTRTIHRLVAIAFIPNPENKPQVNHINEIKTDNRVENLEWCTPLENTRHGTGIERMGIKNSKPVLQICPLTKKLIKRWSSMKETKGGGFVGSNVSKSCRKKRKYKGYLWKLAL